MDSHSHRLLLIDALNLIRRVYAAQPGPDGPERAEAGRDASIQSIERALRESLPTHVACVFDGAGKSWRHELYPAYKAGHAAMPEALAHGLDSYRVAFGKIGVASLCLPRLEADDVIATAAIKAGSAGTDALVLSTDRGFLQLLPNGVRVRDHFNRRDFDAEYVTEKFAVPPEQLVDLLALAGDRGNGIPGVPGIGAKTAARLLDRFGTLESTLASAGEVEGKLGDRLREHSEAVRLYRRLVALKTDLDLETNLNELRYTPGSRA